MHHMKSPISRRDFLKISGLAFSGLAIGRLPSGIVAAGKDVYVPVFPRGEEQDQGILGRVASKQVDIRSRPADDATIVGNRFRDQIIHIYAEVRPPEAPKYYNTLWYRVWGGYVHSAHIQIVQIRVNQPVNWIAEAGQLCEVTVPYTLAYQYNRWDGWLPWRGSRLYYSSVHWATGVEAGPDGQNWYQITSELSESEKYLVPAQHMRLIKPEEYAPISASVPAEKKRVEVSLSEQTLRAYEYDRLVLETKISSGIPNKDLPKDELPTATPEGRFVIYSKMPSKHMGSVAGGAEVEDNGGFSLPGVPWTSFFQSQGGYALHGTYWHNNFGLQMSHGCVNMRNEDAKWLFRWSTPVFDPLKVESPRDWEKTGNGTVVWIYSGK